MKTPPAADQVAFVATGACSSCPYRGSCHEPRKRIQDPRFTLGRHYECEFYQGIDQKVGPLPLSPGARWRKRLRGFFGGAR